MISADLAIVAGVGAFVVMLCCLKLLKDRASLRRIRITLADITKRQAQTTEIARRYQKSFLSCVRATPVPVFVFEMRDNTLIQVSDSFQHWLESNTDTLQALESFSSYFSSKSENLPVFPSFFERLHVSKIEPGTFKDTVISSGIEPNEPLVQEIIMYVDICEELAYVWLDIPHTDKTFLRRMKTDTTVFRSILNETDLFSALESSSALLHCPLDGELACFVSWVERPFRTLKLVWERGLNASDIEAVSHLPLIFGHSPSATAVLTESDFKKEYGATEAASLDSCLASADVELWHAYPVVGTDGIVLGTVNLLSYGEKVKAPSQESIANFLSVVCIMLERKEAMTTIFRQARLDQAVKEVGQRLIVASENDGFSALSDCLNFLMSATDLSGGQLGVAYEIGAGQVALVGSLFGQADLSSGDTVSRISSAIRSLCSDLTTQENNRMACEAISLTSANGIVKKMNADLCIEPKADPTNFLVCSLLLGRGLMGVLIFRSEASNAFDNVQSEVLDMVAPIIASYLARENLLMELEQKANHDQLTGLLNRGCVEELLVSEIGRSSRYSNDLSIILFDIDHFKKINDQFGHDVGDEVLKQVARRAKVSIRGVDTIGRWGGEEFLIILAETDLASARYVAENIRRLIESDVYETSRPVTISAGVSSFVQGDDTTSLVKRADIALYRAKEAGRNQVITAL